MCFSHVWSPCPWRWTQLTIKKCLFLGSWHLEHLLKKTNGHFCLFTHPCVLPFRFFLCNMKYVFFSSHTSLHIGIDNIEHIYKAPKRNKMRHKSVLKNSMNHYFATFQLFWSLNTLCVRIKPSSKFHWIYPPTSKLWNIDSAWVALGSTDRQNSTNLL